MAKEKFNLASAIRGAVRADKTFSHFDLGFDAAALDALRALKINQSTTYDNFGEISSLKSDAAHFLEKLGNTPFLAARVASQIDRVCREAIQAFGAEAAWCTIRAATPTDDYDIPRWHKDGYFVLPFIGDQRKMVAALKGNQTLLNDFPQGLRDHFNVLSAMCDPNDMAARKEIAKLVDASRTSIALPGQGSIFIVGSDRAAIHSEPAIHEERLFLSVLPGTIAQIIELRDRWKMTEKVGLPPKGVVIKA